MLPTTIPLGYLKGCAQLNANNGFGRVNECVHNDLKNSLTVLTEYERLKLRS
jgi:hypothetical protein